MPEDIITYVCSDLSTNAPKAEAGLRDQACDRILGRYIQEEALERVRDDPEDLLACLRECITLDNEQLAKAKEALGKLAPPAPRMIWRVVDASMSVTLQNELVKTYI